MKRVAPTLDLILTEKWDVTGKWGVENAQGRSTGESLGGEMLGT